MAEQQQGQQPQEELVPIKTLFPAPPPFYKNFTKQNVNELKRLRKEADIPASGSGSQSQPQTNGEQPTTDQKKDLDILSLPPELRYFFLPQPPPTETYTSFGLTQSLHASDSTLASRGIEQLYPSHPSVTTNPQPHLLALARSLLTKYLHILGVLSNQPEAYEESTKELETIVYNLHDLINRYRPHQAREQLILMMEERVERLRGEVRGIEEGERRARELVGGFAGEGEDGMVEDGQVDGGKEAADGEQKKGVVEKRQKDTWAALGREMEEG